MSYEIREATIEDAIYVSQNLRDADREELAGLGHNPFQVILGFHFCEDAFTVLNHQKEIAGIGGFIPDGAGNAYIWVLCTPALESMKYTFFRRARAEIEKRSEPYYNMLYAYCDSRNKLHHRFLKYMGFKALRAVPQAPYHIPYLEVVKLCAMSD